MALLVACDLAAGAAVLYARSGPASAAGHSGTAAQGSGAAGDTVAQGGILGAGHFSNRRGSGRAGAAGEAAAPSAPPITTSSVTAPDNVPPAGATGANGANGASGANGAAGSNGANGPNGAPGSNGANGAAGAKGTNSASSHSSQATNSQTTDAFSDRAGDTDVDGRDAARAEKAADIVQSHAVYNGRALVFALKTEGGVDPKADPRWASDSTYISWEVDTNGDSVPDYEVQYSLTDGAPLAGISRIGDDDAASVCDSEAGFLTEGYTVAFDAACIGAPSSFSYRATIYYDTDPADEEADVVTDVTPDGGLSRPVSRPAG
jgi:hypothetical protein